MPAVKDGITKVVAVGGLFLRKGDTLMNGKIYGLGVGIISSLVMLAPALLLAGNNAVKPSKEEVVQKAQGLQMPFIANEGQVDEQVKYYAKTFSGTVYVTRDGDILYALPKYEKEVKDGRTPISGEDLTGKIGGTGVYGAVLCCFYDTETVASMSKTPRRPARSPFDCAT